MRIFRLIDESNRICIYLLNVFARYDAYSGTSMATPHVSGVAALIWSHQTSKTAKEVRKALVDSAKDLGEPGRDNRYGHGLVQADKALQFLEGSLTLAPNPSPPPCTDITGWVDAYGDGCEWYELNDNEGCTNYGGSFAAPDGLTAKDTCCHCGGGSNGPPNPTQAPTKAPTKAPTNPPVSAPSSLCTDITGWVDAYGDGCEWYELNDDEGCPNYGGFFTGADGLTAKDACCHCNGGTS